MKTIVYSKGGQEHIRVENDAEDISIWQGEDFVMLFNAKMARKFIKAIRASMEDLGWAKLDIGISRDITVSHGAGGITLMQLNPRRGPDHIRIETKEQLDKMIEEMQAARDWLL